MNQLQCFVLNRNCLCRLKFDFWSDWMWMKRFSDKNMTKWQLVSKHSLCWHRHRHSAMDQLKISLHSKSRKQEIICTYLNLYQFSDMKYNTSFVYRFNKMENEKIFVYSCIHMPSKFKHLLNNMFVSLYTIGCLILIVVHSLPHDDVEKFFLNEFE